MRSTVRRKILIIALALIMALSAIFAAKLNTLCGYAAESPDAVSAYDDGGKPGPGAIAPPTPSEDDDVDWVVEYQQTNFGIEKLEIRVEDWVELGLGTRARLNPNPDGKYDGKPELVEKIQSLLNGDFVSYVKKDSQGNVVTDAEITSMPAGSTVFIHPTVDEKCQDSIEFTYAEGVHRSYSYVVPYPASATLNAVSRLNPLVYEVDYEGEPVNLQQIVDKVLQDRSGYLMFVESESDALVQNSIGEYILTFCFKAGSMCYWQGTNRDMSAEEVRVVIRPKTLEVVDYLGAWFYTGYNIDVASKLEEYYGDYVAVVRGSTIGRDAQVYTFDIAIKGDYSGNVQWANGVQGAVTVSFTINKSQITGDWGPMGDYGRITVTSETYPGIQAGDIEYTYTDQSGNVVASNELVVGQTYEAEVHLLNPNLEWTAEPEKHTFTLTKQLVELENPVIDKKTAEYTGYPITFNVTIGGKSITDPEFADLIEINTELSDSLTQTDVGDYKIVIEPKDESVSWSGNVTGAFVIEFSITKIVIDINWDYYGDPQTFPYPSFSSTYSGTDYLNNIVKISYIDSITNLEVNRKDFKSGQNYKVVVTLLNDKNFEFKEGVETERGFTFNDIKFTEIVIPELVSTEAAYTGKPISFEVKDKALLEEYISQGYIYEDGAFDVTDAGEYTVTLTIRNANYVWTSGEETVKLTFKINKAVLSGSWGNDGKIAFSSTFEGNYDDVVEYEYKDSNGNVVAYSDLVEGQTYTATVKLKDGMESNFDDSAIEKEKTFTFSAAQSGEKSNWWIFLIIGLAVLLLIIIIIIIIVVKKRRGGDDNYDDFYGDEYYGDDEEAEEGDEDENYDDYGDDSYGDNYGDDNYGGY